MSNYRATAALLAGLFLAGTLPADEPYGSTGDLKVARPADKEDVQSVPAPKGAVVLFDGKILSAWHSRRDPKAPAKWQLVDGAVQVNGTGDIVTREKFDGPYKLHVEFRVPY